MKQERIRKLLSLNPEVESHRKALELLEEHGCSSDYVVECILTYESRLTRADLRQELQALLQQLPVIRQQKEEPDPVEAMPVVDESLSRIPGSMFDLLKQI